jgi:hypothetical protein
MYALCTTVCYQDEMDDLLNQHSEILADKFVFVFQILLSKEVAADADLIRFPYRMKINPYCLRYRFTWRDM